VCRAIFQLVRYDVVHRLFRAEVRSTPLKANPAVGLEREAAICEAVELACCFYWKPMLCLPRAVCTMRLLRAHGIAAHVVIGYRPAPFFSHAWVEVGGRVVNDSSSYKRQLRVLRTI
jgi:hypothetical protein